MASRHDADDHLAYGDESEDVRDSARQSLKAITDFYKKLVSADEPHDALAYSQPPSRSTPKATSERDRSFLDHISSMMDSVAGGPQSDGGGRRKDSTLLGKLNESFQRLSSDFKHHFSGAEGSPSPSVTTEQVSDAHRFDSFAPERPGNDVKWFVDGCSYFWAVSLALESAQSKVWILDWWLSPELYLRRPPSQNENYRLDRLLKAAAERGVKINIVVYKEVTQALTLSSAHTKHALEDLHPNICVIRHPDHLPAGETLKSSFLSAVQNSKITAASAGKAGEDALKAVFGMYDDTILFWAHHEKLCIIDDRMAFMGGLDLCFGRWDTNQHPLADAHPGDLNDIVFSGQDYNNARIMDFQDVSNWSANKLSRSTNARMGWSDVSVCVSGPTVKDLQSHFAHRWNFIYDEKYRDQARYSALDTNGPMVELEPAHEQMLIRDKSTCQIMRSCDKWSNGTKLEHSIQNAYVSAIHDAEHFIYIENQFFITATGDHQKPIQNQIGIAIVERILRAARAGKNFQIIVVMPAIPGFAGDLRNDDSMSTRAIMQYQYWSINRGGHSIYECIAKEGFEPSNYIRFYNLRNYDRINSNASMKEAEKQSGVTYEEARSEFDELAGSGYTKKDDARSLNPEKFRRYQLAAKDVMSAKHAASSRWDTVSECYMLGGEDIRNVPWEEGGDLAEIDAFVSEELYVHTKVMIIDDRKVICGSANLNDRSQLGSHDSEIAILVEDSDLVDSTMDGLPYMVSRFATSLRRYLFRKHVGLLKPQDMTKPNDNYMPLDTGNTYDWGSAEDKLVEDPLSVEFQQLWRDRARVNTDAFAKVFHPVPHEGVRTWKQYEEYYERFFHSDTKKTEALSRWKWGHVVGEAFDSVDEVKEELSKIKGMLVDMPLNFLIDEQLAKEGLSLNIFTEQVYT